MARSSSVRRWLEELRYETESYDPQVQLQQQDTASTVTWRYARVTWGPEIAVDVSNQNSNSNNNNTNMALNQVNYLKNEVPEVLIQNEDDENIILDGDGEKTEESEKNSSLRNRLATVSVPVNTVSNNVKRFQNTLFAKPSLQSKLNEEIVLRRPQNLQISNTIPQRPRSQQNPPKTSHSFRDIQNVHLPIVIKEGPINKVKLLCGGTSKSTKHWKTGMHALLTDRALFFFDDGEALIAMKSGAAVGGVSSKDRVVNLHDGARIVQDTDRAHSTKRNVLAICNRDGHTVVLMQNDDHQLSNEWYTDIVQVIKKHSKDSDTPTGENVINTKSVLNWFFKKRPNKETLVNQGIYKNEPIFGNTLERLFEASEQKRLVPAFVVRCTEILENPPHVFSIGLYRTSGNLSHIQRLRLRVDQEDADALEDPSISLDSDVLAGALKLFFRELQVPLLPYKIYMGLSDACRNSDFAQRFTLIKDILEKQLPKSHYHTLARLCAHLLRVTVHERQNQMSSANLAIVWGPSFTWPDEGTGTRALHLCTDVNRIVQYLIENTNELFT